MGAGKFSRHQQESEREANLTSVIDTRSGSGVVLGVFVALLILFLWLHFIVAHENESIGRKIQAQTEELARIERVNMALRQQIAATCAEAVIAERARALGYRPQQPLYLLLNRPLVPVASGAHTDAFFEPSILRDTQAAESNTQSGANPVAGTDVEASSGTVDRP